MQKITGKIEISPESFARAQSAIKNIVDFQKELEKSYKQEISKFLETILEGGIFLNSSDIHIEPEEKKAKIRIRVDGLLREISMLDIEKHKAILSRIKLVSKIKLNVNDRPQDGRFSILIPCESGQKTEIEIRVSILPSEYGESIVLRILNPKSLVEVEKLGLREDLLQIFKEQIKKPNGMIITTGPTGSGKTTTLYAFLKNIKKPEIKIITIEDPIEYHLKGISQTQVAAGKGYDFASGLKAIVRQDPDAILVGEIRDMETAQIALQAALTGHLVLTTLHTNDAPGTIARLISLGAKAVNIAPALKLVIAQRLVRKVCQTCGKLETISLEDLKKIKEELRGIPQASIFFENNNKDIKVLAAKGCEDCNFTGYKGRAGIFEAFVIDQDIERLILEKPSTSVLREKLIKKGMITIKQDGFLSVLNKITTIEEIERVAGK